MAVSGPAGRSALLEPSPGAATVARGVVVVAGQPDAPGVPLLAGRPLVDGAPAAYVCRGFVCDRPSTDPAALAGGADAAVQLADGATRGARTAHSDCTATV